MHGCDEPNAWASQIALDVRTLRCQVSDTTGRSALTQLSFSRSKRSQRGNAAIPATKASASGAKLCATAVITAEKTPGLGAGKIGLYGFCANAVAYRSPKRQIR